MSPSLQPGVAVSENTADEPTRTPLEMLRGVTRHLATAESLEVVLQSIATALVNQADAVNSRIFLALTDAECPVCVQWVHWCRRPPSRLTASRAGLTAEEHLSHRVASMRRCRLPSNGDSAIPPD
jgi:hypothetical protein